MQSFVEHFHFLRPGWLLAMLPAAYLLWLYAKRKKHGGKWKSVCDSKLIPHILIGEETKTSVYGLVVIALSTFIIVLALAGPTWQQLPQPVFREQSSLVIVLDLSRSMDAADVKPNRVTRAKHKIIDILQRRKEGQTALVVYALEPFTVTPLTDDSNTIQALVKSLSTELMPNQGSLASTALEHAVDLLQQAGSATGDILLITDGVDASASTLEKIRRQGYQVSILGIGTKVGAPIPTSNGGFLTNDESGEIVIAKLDSSSLKILANKSGGVYSNITSDDADINKIMAKVSGNNRDQISLDEEGLSLHADQWREEGPWLLLVLVPFIMLIFRRGYLVCLVIMVMPYSENSMAFEWRDMWATPNQQASQEFTKENHSAAAELFENSEWKSAAHYREQNYQASIKELEGLNSPDALYNKANAMVKSGQIEEAIKSYEEAINLDPNHEDAKYNRDLLKDFMKKQEDKNKDSDNKNDQAENRSSDEESQDNNGEQKEGDKQNAQDSSNSQAKNKDQSPVDKDENSKQDQGKDKAAKENQEKNKQQQAQAEKEGEETEAEEQKVKSATDNLSKEEMEKQLANEQWLKQIPDDPGGLLRRKFIYQSQNAQRKQTGDHKPW